MGICFQTLRPRKRGFLHKTGFPVPHRNHFDGSSEWKELRFRLLETEANAVIYTNISNELGFWPREPRLVTYAPEISLLRGLVASQPKEIDGTLWPTC